jgi:hypothetical protein
MINKIGVEPRDLICGALLGTFAGYSFGSAAIIEICWIGKMKEQWFDPYFSGYCETVLPMVGTTLGLVAGVSVPLICALAQKIFKIREYSTG